jgi:signal transduction histidine kinase
VRGRRGNSWAAIKSNAQHALPPERERAHKLYGDSTRLDQAVANLLDNAAKYTDDGGVISLSAEQDESDVVIGIRDNGHGISAELLPCIFDLYAQLNCPAHKPD